ncbi:hypothetical protein [Rossellomorea sp. DUT-2]|uniref:hypothetical protein n=1 Tax=Rossellomorea sp. DUT-2 TaxID=3412021 RepID=UPI003D17662E
MDKNSEIQLEHLRVIESWYPFSKKITPRMIYKKRDEIADRLMETYPRQYSDRELRYPNLYSKWKTPVEEFDVDFPDYTSMNIVPTDGVDDRDSLQSTDILYWDAVHEGEINPDEDVSVHDPRGDMDYTEYRLRDEDRAMMKIHEILSSDLSDKLKSKALIHLSGVGIEKFDQLANSKVKELVHTCMHKIAEKEDLSVKKSAYKFWLEDCNKNRFLSIHMGRYPADVFHGKEIDFHGEITNDKMGYVLQLLTLTGYEIDSSLEKMLKSDEVIRSNSWSNYIGGDMSDSSSDLRVYVSINESSLGVSLGGMGGAQGIT